MFYLIKLDEETRRLVEVNMVFQDIVGYIIGGEKQRKNMKEEKPIYLCDTCGDEIYFMKESYTMCLKCEKHFCSSFFQPECFINHKKKDNCRGEAFTILDPQFMLNFSKMRRNSNENGN